MRRAVLYARLPHAHDSAQRTLSLEDFLACLVQNVLGPVTEQVLGATIPTRDHAVEVLGYNGVKRGLDDSGQQRGIRNSWGPVGIHLFHDNPTRLAGRGGSRSEI